MTVTSVAFKVPVGAVPGCAGHTPEGCGPLEVSAVVVAPVASLLAELVLDAASDVLLGAELEEPPLEPLTAVGVDVEELPDAPVVVAGATEPVV